MEITDQKREFRLKCSIDVEIKRLRTKKAKTRVIQSLNANIFIDRTDKSVYK